jgi:hypothetical protein
MDCMRFVSARSLPLSEDARDDPFFGSGPLVKAKCGTACKCLLLSRV